MMAKTRGLVIAGVSCLVVGLIWNFGFPINKHIWSSSFVVFAGGWCFLLLALFYWIIDVKGWKTWAFPFVVIGLNAITVYFGQRIVDFGHTSDFILSGVARLSGDFRPVVLAMGVLALKWAFLYFLYRKRMFLKV